MNFRIVYDPHPIGLEGKFISRRQAMRAFEDGALLQGTLLKQGRLVYALTIYDGQKTLRPVAARGHFKSRLLAEDELKRKCYCRHCGQTDPEQFPTDNISCCLNCQDKA